MHIDLGVLWTYFYTCSTLSNRTVLKSSLFLSQKEFTERRKRCVATDKSIQRITMWKTVNIVSIHLFRLDVILRFNNNQLQYSELVVFYHFCVKYEQENVTPPEKLIKRNSYNTFNPPFIVRKVFHEIYRGGDLLCTFPWFNIIRWTVYRDFFNTIVHLLVNQQMCNISLKSFLWTPKCINIVFNLRITAIVWKYLSEAKVSFLKKTNTLCTFT